MNKNKMQEIIDLLYERNQTFAIAESITCGEITSQLLSANLELEKIFKGSVVAYTMKAHESLLKLSRDFLNQYGLLSREVSIENALAIKRLLNSTLAIGVSGNLTTKVFHGKQPGVVYFTIIYHDVITNYSLKINQDVLTDHKTIVAEQIVDEIHKLLFEKAN